MIDLPEFSVRCPRCRSSLCEVVTVGRVVANSERSTVHACRCCRFQWQVMVRVLPVRRDSQTAFSEQCGTEAGYHVHRRHHQEPCEACREAHNAASVDRAARRRLRVV